MSSNVTKNRFGFFELINKPAYDELKSYYADKYYQECNSTYANKYSQDEIKYINNKIEQKYAVISDLVSMSNKSGLRLLDIGSGEGWALKYFKDKLWDVVGLDYSEYGCYNHNPECLVNLTVGEIGENIEKLIRKNQSFDVIWLDNVLEHVLDPLELLINCHKLIKEHGVLVIEVPNDFSAVQQCLLDKEYIHNPYWIAIPDHISYFNNDGLNAICSEAGWHCHCLMGDYPIDFNLLNQNVNYIKDTSKGKSCHHARVEVENLLHSISIEKTNNLYRALADLGLGREIIGFFRKAELS